MTDDLEDRTHALIHAVFTLLDRHESRPREVEGLISTLIRYWLNGATEGVPPELLEATRERAWQHLRGTVEQLYRNAQPDAATH